MKHSFTIINFNGLFKQDSASLKDTFLCQFSCIRFVLDLAFVLLFPCSQLYMVSADNLCKQFGPRLGWTECESWSGSNLFFTLCSWKNLVDKLSLKKSQQTTTKDIKLPSIQRVKHTYPDKSFHPASVENPSHMHRRSYQEY